MDEQLFHSSMHMLGMVVPLVKPEDWNKPTPCSEWDVKALMNHILNEVAWIEPLLQGNTIEEVGTSLDGDLVGEDPVKSWHEICEKAINAADKTPDDTIVHLSYGDKTARDYVNEVGGDVIVHGWDLAQAIGAPYTIDSKTCEGITDAMGAILPMAKSAGLVKDLPDAPEDASDEEKLLAQFGRSKNWKK